VVEVVENEAREIAVDEEKPEVCQSALVSPPPKTSLAAAAIEVKRGRTVWCPSWIMLLTAKGEGAAVLK